MSFENYKILWQGELSRYEDLIKNEILEEEQIKIFKPAICIKCNFKNQYLEQDNYICFNCR